MTGCADVAGTLNGPRIASLPLNCTDPLRSASVALRRMMNGLNLSRIWRLRLFHGHYIATKTSNDVTLPMPGIPDKCKHVLTTSLDCSLHCTEYRLAALQPRRGEFCLGNGLGELSVAKQVCLHTSPHSAAMPTAINTGDWPATNGMTTVPLTYPRHQQWKPGVRNRVWSPGRS